MCIGNTFALLEGPLVLATVIQRLRVELVPGQAVVPLPEGWQYLGFIFARAETPAAVEHALRQAHARLHFAIE